MKRIMILAAHPDDEVLGCGGIISKYRNQKVDFKIVFIGEGSSCRFDDPLNFLALDAIKQRELAALSAMKILGVDDYEFHNMPCGRFNQIPIIEINKIIERAIVNFCPDTILMHSLYDANNDHKIVFKSAIMATRPSIQNKILKLLTYEVPSSSEWAYSASFMPNIFEQLQSEDMQRKWQALLCYQTEIKPFPFPRSQEGLKTFAMMRGMQSGFQFAEAFQLIREFRL